MVVKLQNWSSGQPRPSHVVLHLRRGQQNCPWTCPSSRRGRTGTHRQLVSSDLKFNGSTICRSSRISWRPKRVAAATRLDSACRFRRVDSALRLQQRPPLATRMTSGKSGQKPQPPTTRHLTNSLQLYLIIPIQSSFYPFPPFSDFPPNFFVINSLLLISYLIRFLSSYSFRVLVHANWESLSTDLGYFFEFIILDQCSNGGDRFLLGLLFSCFFICSETTEICCFFTIIYWK